MASDKEKLPEDFPGYEELKAERITTYGQVRKRLEAGDLTEISGIGAATEERISEALEGGADDEAGDETDTDTDEKPSTKRDAKAGSADKSADEPDGEGDKADNKPHPDLSGAQIVPSAPNSPDRFPPGDTNPDGTPITENQKLVRERLAARAENQRAADAAAQTAREEKPRSDIVSRRSSKRTTASR